jgi:hypothetical protein
MSTDRFPDPPFQVTKEFVTWLIYHSKEIPTGQTPMLAAIIGPTPLMKEKHAKTIVNESDASIKIDGKVWILIYGCSETKK